MEQQMNHDEVKSMHACHDNKCANDKKCGCHHHKAVPIIIIATGVTFLLGALDALNPSTVAIIWPNFLIAIGFMKIMKRQCKCC